MPWLRVASEALLCACDRFLAKAQLRKPGLDAAKVEAEVAKLYAEREKTLAETRKRTPKPTAKRSTT